MSKAFILTILYLALLFSINLSGARAATRTVDTTADAGGLSACTTAANDCSLRGAVSGAAPNDTVEFDASLTNATITLTGVINLTRSINITGLGADKLTISGGGATRLFTNFGGSNLNLYFSNLTISGGNGIGGDNSGQGGAIQINGNSATANFDNIVFRDNGASGIGGALLFYGGECRISNSTFFNNSSSNAAAIYISGGSLRVTNSTFSGNISPFTSIIESNERPVIIRNSTIVNNTGIGLSKSSGTLILGNTIVAGNSDYDIYQFFGSAIQSSGGNLIGNNFASGANFPAGQPNANSDYVGTNADPINPLLGDLTDNGGTTPTHALLPGSPAIDRGNNCVLTASGCGAGDLPTALINDQRGAGFLRSFGGTVDIGAFEYQTPIAIVTNDADSGAGSLRQIILEADPGDTIVFDPAFFNQARTITLGSYIFIGKNLTINGTGANLLTIDGGAGDYGIFDSFNAILKIKDVTLQNVGNPAAQTQTSVISAQGGTVTLENVLVQNNRNNSGYGTLTFIGGSNHQIINSTITNNTEINCAGFLATSNSTVFVTNTTISGNSAVIDNGVRSGGGICSYANSTVTLRNSTITNNNAEGSGGGIYVEFNATVNIGNTIVAGNTSPFGSDIHIGSGMIQTVGNNLIGDNASVEALFPFGNPNANNDFAGSPGSPLSARLAPLGNYGGKTPTHALFPDSPAINNGNGAVNGTPLTDQRRAARVGAPDIGAFERNVGIDQTSLPNAYTGQNYNQNLTAVRLGSFSRSFKQTNLAPFTFETIPVGGESLPNGLTLAATGQINGSATTVGSYVFTVKATDSDGMAGVQKVLIDVLAPSAASVSVSGRVLTINGRSIPKATVSLIDSHGNMRTSLTNQFGFYSFRDVTVGEFYTFNVSAKQHSFASRLIEINEEIYELNFTSRF